MKTESQVAHALEDFIKGLGAPSGLMSDKARSETGKAVQALCRMYNIYSVSDGSGTS
jgi:hypothetical protein